MNVIDCHSIDILTKFIIPMVFKANIKHNNLPILSYKTYLSIIDEPEYDDKIIIVSNIPINKSLIRDDIYYKTILKDGEYLTILTPPPEYEDNIYIIIGGNYSKLSEEYKRRLLYFWDEDKDSKLFGILFKNKYKRFTEEQYLTYKHEIEHAKEYYPKPLYTEIIYGLKC